MNWEACVGSGRWCERGRFARSFTRGKRGGPTRPASTSRRLSPHSRSRIVSGSRRRHRVAASDPPHRSETAAKNAVSANRLEPVERAARLEAAGDDASHPRREVSAIAFDGRDRRSRRNSSAGRDAQVMGGAGAEENEKREQNSSQAASSQTSGSCALGQSSFSLHSLHFGFRAMQISRP